MPEVLRLFGFSFMFYSNEHEPIHIHVVGKGGRARYVLSEENKCFVETECYKIKGSDMKRIREVISDNTDLFIEMWNHFFYE